MKVFPFAIVFLHIKMLTSFGKKNANAEAQDLRVFFLYLLFDVGTCEALILLVKKNLASSPQMNRKYAVLHPNLIKPIPLSIPLEFSPATSLIYGIRKNVCNPAFRCLDEFWGTQYKTDMEKLEGPQQRVTRMVRTGAFDLWEEAEEAGLDHLREGKGSGDS